MPGTVTRLDYEPVRRKPRRPGPSGLLIIGWIASCMIGAFAGSAIMLSAMGFSTGAEDVACCAPIGGALASVLGVPALAFFEDAPSWLKLLIGFAAAFTLNAAAAFLLIAALIAG